MKKKCYIILESINQPYLQFWLELKKNVFIKCYCVNSNLGTLSMDFNKVKIF